MTRSTLGAFTAATATIVLLQATAAPSSESSIELQVRVFDGLEEVTEETKATVYPSGKREGSTPTTFTPGRGLTATVPPGLYDIQTVRHRQDQVVNIRWSERLLVLDYPDEGGQHLEVTNFKSGFGALQLRPQPGVDVGQLSVAVFAGGDRVVEAGKPRTGDGYLLFVLPAGKYDVLVAQGGQSVWVADIDVPLDRTRLKQIAAPASRRP